MLLDMEYPGLSDGTQLVAVKVFTLDGITIEPIADFFWSNCIARMFDIPSHEILTVYGINEELLMRETRP